VQKRGKEKGRSWFSGGPWLVLVLLVFVTLTWLVNRDSLGIGVKYNELKYGELKQILHDPTANFQKVHVGRSDIRGEIVTRDLMTDGGEGGFISTRSSFHTPRTGLEIDTTLQELLDKRVGSGYQGEEDDPMRGISQFIISSLLLIGLVFAAVLIFRWVSGNPLTFGRSKHKLYAQKDLQITFQDVAGIDEAVAELREVVDFLRTPDKYQALGGRIPKGVLLVGPPGTGKTLLAKAVAGEADVPFFGLSGSDFVEMFVGVGAARVRDLFGQAESRAPCIIFIDELDAMGKTRGNSAIGGHDEREQTLNQLLVEMDGFDSNRGVIIMAATNRPETLDAALLRPGRFDRTVVVDRPDIVGREAILKVHVRNVKVSENVDLRHVASLTPGSVGADLANLVNEAALMAARRNKDAVTREEFDEAIERGAIGLERKSRIMRPDEKLRVAYHEAGHALVAVALPNTDPVHKVSIIPRGVGALGYVLQRPEDDRHLQTQSELESKIKICLAGTMAEELIYREVSNGATNDLEHASNIARRMVKEFGMSGLGRIFYKESNDSAFLPGMPFGGEREYSEKTAREIDMEVRKILGESMAEVQRILLERRQGLEAVAQKLVETEVMDGAELRQILERECPAIKLVPGTLPTGLLESDRREEGLTPAAGATN
jgi:cell division protease FtsH